MAFVDVSPELVEAAAHRVAGIGSTLSEATAGFDNPITSVATAAEDEVSVAIAALFSAHGQAFQILNTQAATFHAQFAQALSEAQKAYLAAEAAIVQTLQSWDRLPGGSNNTAVIQLLILG